MKFQYLTEALSREDQIINSTVDLSKMIGSEVRSEMTDPAEVILLHPVMRSE